MADKNYSGTGISRGINTLKLVEGRCQWNMANKMNIKPDLPVIENIRDQMK